MMGPDILRITEAEQLFCRGVVPSADRIRNEYRAFARTWHPDRNHDAGASDVFAHITRLYDEALVKTANNTWETPGLFTATDTTGRFHRYAYRVRRPFELGRLYVGDAVILFEIEERYREYFKTARHITTAFRYPGDAVRKDIERCLPCTDATFCANDRIYLAVKKTADLVSLQDVLLHFGGTMDPKAVAWVVSVLLNLSCYLQWAGVAHNAIGPETIWISPQYHSGALLGGWWYSAFMQQHLVAVPSRTALYAPPDVLRSKIPSTRVDLELIKATGRELLGDASGARLNGKAPDAMLTWLRLPSGGDAIDDYKVWKDDVLVTAFGRRRFTPMSLTADEIYR